MNIEPIIEKIKACIRLANRTTESGERDTAMRMAKNLADRNGIALDDVTVDDAAPDRAVIENDADYKYWTGCEMGYAFYILKEHFGTVVIQQRERAKRSKFKLIWFGSHLNIDISKHILHVLLRECRRAYREEQNGKFAQVKDIVETAMQEMNYQPMYIKNELRIARKGLVKRNDFMAGFFSSIDAYLEKHPLRNDAAEAKKRAEDKLDEYRKDRNVRESKRRNGKSEIDRESFMAGLERGSAVHLARPCEGYGESPLALTA